MSFMIASDSKLVKYNEIWNKTKKILNIRFHIMPAYDEKEFNVKEFNGVVNKNFWGDKVPKEGVHHICLACLSIDSVMKMDKKNYAQVYLEECKYKIKKKKMSGIKDVELESDSASDSEWL